MICDVSPCDDVIKSSPKEQPVCYDITSCQKLLNVGCVVVVGLQFSDQGLIFLLIYFYF